MKITFSPQRSDEGLLLEKQGDVLTINGEPFDLSVIPDGATLPEEGIDSLYIIGSIERVNGEIEITILTPHGHNPPHNVAFPEPLIDADDGVLYDYQPR